MVGVHAGVGVIPKTATTLGGRRGGHHVRLGVPRGGGESCRALLQRW